MPTARLLVYDHIQMHASTEAAKEFLMHLGVVVLEDSNVNLLGTDQSLKEVRVKRLLVEPLHTQSCRVPNRCQGYLRRGRRRRRRWNRP